VSLFRISVTLLIVGLLMADFAALAVFVHFKYFGFVLAGLASATLGGLGLAQRYRYSPPTASPPSAAQSVSENPRLD